VSPRLLRPLVALAALVTAGFGLYQLYFAGHLLRAHYWVVAALYAMLGIAGLAISNALWRVLRKPK
jgi:hypothetical protein